MKRTLHAALFVLAALLLSACATLTKLAYSNAALAYTNLSPMMAWLVDDYVEMSGGQKDWVRDRIDRLMDWHRSQELPRYHRFLQKVLAETEEPFTVQEVDEAYRDLRLYMKRTIEQALPDVAEFMLQLDSLQVLQMEKKFAEDNRKFVRESVKGTPEERMQRRVKRFSEHMEGWLGDLTPAQRRLIADYYRGMPDHVEERLAERRLRQVETLALIRAKPSKDEMVAGLRRLMLEGDTWRRPEFQKKLDDRQRRFFELLVSLSASLDADQRSHLQKRIRGFMKDINTLTVGRVNVSG